MLVCSRFFYIFCVLWTTGLCSEQENLLGHRDHGLVSPGAAATPCSDVQWWGGVILTHSDWGNPGYPSGAGGAARSWEGAGWKSISQLISGCGVKWMNEQEAWVRCCYICSPVDKQEKHDLRESLIWQRSTTYIFSPRDINTGNNVWSNYIYGLVGYWFQSPSFIIGSPRYNHRSKSPFYLRNQPIVQFCNTMSMESLSHLRGYLNSTRWWWVRAHLMSGRGLAADSHAGTNLDNGIQHWPRLAKTSVARRRKSSKYDQRPVKM